MKLGVSTYSLLPAIESGEMTVLDVIDWVADLGGEHVEIVPFGFKLVDNDELVDAIREKAAERNIDISNYSILANLLPDTEEEYRNEIERLKKEVDIANRLGVKRMRHDVSAFRRPMNQNTIIHYEKELPKMVAACREIADYANQYGITTTVENHGFYVNGSDRVQRLIEEVNRDNYRLTLDVGNFLCMDENPVMGTKKLVQYTEVVHLKDFYIRKADRMPGAGMLYRCDSGTWFQSYGGDLLRGSIIGQGDIDLWGILGIIKSSEFDGYITIEFEGMEPCKLATEQGFRLANEIWKRI